MKTICKKSIVISIILLLIGVSVSSAISVDTESTISNNQSEECRECNKVDDRQLVVLEKQIDRLEVYSKLVLVLSKHHPEITEMSMKLSELTNVNRPLCELVLNIGINFINKFEYYVELAGYFYNESREVLGYLCTLLALFYYGLSFYIGIIYYDILKCEPISII
jgi:hypothetical protein